MKFSRHFLAVFAGAGYIPSCGFTSWEYNETIGNNLGY